MTWIDRLERRFGWMAFPSLLRFYAILTAMVFVLEQLRPDIRPLLEFDLLAILSGELWRVVTFLFASSHVSGGWPLPLQILFMYFVIRIAFMMSDALEGVWGVFRTTLFFYVGILSLIVVNFGSFGLLSGTGVYIYVSAFFAFATLFPKVEFLMFFVLPVQVRFIALFGVVMLLAQLADLFLKGATLIAMIIPLFYVLIFANYILWAGIPVLRGRRMLVKAAQRRRKFEVANQPANDAFHDCVVCGRTEKSDPRLEFRISADGKEYCLNHLPEELEKDGEDQDCK